MLRVRDSNLIRHFCLHGRHVQQNWVIKLTAQTRYLGSLILIFLIFFSAGRRTQRHIHSEFWNCHMTISDIWYVMTIELPNARFSLAWLCSFGMGLLGVDIFFRLPVSIEHVTDVSNRFNTFSVIPLNKLSLCLRMRLLFVWVSWMKLHPSEREGGNNESGESSFNTATKRP
jgi:hypothetical protein